MARRIISVLILALTAWCASAVDVNYNVFNATNANVGSLQVWIDPLYPVGTNSSGIVLRDRVKATNSALGQLVVSNVVEAYSYRITIHGPFGQTVFTNTFPAGLTGYVNAKDYVDYFVTAPVGSGYSQAAANALFLPKSGGTATNLNLSRATTLVNVSGGTNASMIVSNTIVYVLNTNQIVVASGGTTSANGNYYRVSPSSDSFTNGTFGLYGDGGDIDYPGGIITNAAGTQLYGSGGEFLGGSWVTVGGIAPAPTVYYPTNRAVTNAELYLTEGVLRPGSSLGTNDIYINAAIGNDTFAIPGRPDRPFQTISNAITLTGNKPNRRYIVAGGNYTNQTFELLSSKLIGQGRDVTYIWNDGQERAIRATGTNCAFEGFSSTIPLILGNETSGVAATNTTINNCSFNGFTDGLLMNRWDGLEARNSKFKSFYDAVADQQGLQASTRSNYTARLINCELECNYSTVFPTLIRGIVLGSSKIIMDGGSITVRNGQFNGVNACVYGEPSYHYEFGSVELSNVRLFYSNTNSQPSYTIQGGLNGTNVNATIYGMSVNPSDTTNTTLVPIERNGSFLTNVVNVQYPTNVIGTRPTFSFTTGVTVQYLVTNATFQFLPPANVSPSNWQCVIYYVSNSLAASSSTIAAIAPGGVFTNGGGPWLITNGGMTAFSFWNTASTLTNAMAVPLR